MFSIIEAIKNLVQLIKDFWVRGLVNKLIVGAGLIVAVFLVFKLVKGVLRIIFYVALTLLIAALIYFFIVKFWQPSKGGGREVELSRCELQNTAKVRCLDKNLIQEKIEQGKEFLYQMMDKDKAGFHKWYYASTDSFEPRLHTVYSASIVYTFSYIYSLTGDKKNWENLPQWGDFLLSMQNKDRGAKRYGAFHYSYWLESGEKEKEFVVGTSALTIFTLLKLFDLTRDSKYLESARLAGNWLITMQKENGSMRAYVRFSESKGKWVRGSKESLLYNGQVLSALSRLYGLTGEENYLKTAEGIAKYFVKKYKKARGYIDDEYRPKNPISNAWVVMSLIDFYKVQPDAQHKDIIFKLSKKILSHQKNDPQDPSHFGSWGGAFSSSGNGWLSEVMAETYIFCKEQNQEGCQNYKEGVVKAIRWLVQSTYSKDNSSFLPNPLRASGGVFWAESNKSVRTDSVCHALNSYLRILPHLPDGVLLSVPEFSGL